ncbi:MAG: Asp-tRNA(Asn)/Glu-tRNA(Gln) amidotransferase subunit GatC [Thermodesulfovibrionales bacterium]|nr:Asp-tRNA(Asn)/Glu-tRNA(Gln) amidotransferase subunit GatC [Thermodesulfovibrionales bacterium]
MKVSAEDVRYIAGLSRLELSDDEIQRMRTDLNDILLYIDKLNELNTTNVEPTSHVLDISNVFQEDIPSQSLDVDRALANAPDRQDSYFRVPKIIE